MDTGLSYKVLIFRRHACPLSFNSTSVISKIVRAHDFHWVQSFTLDGGSWGLDFFYMTVKEMVALVGYLDLHTDFHKSCLESLYEAIGHLKKKISKRIFVPAHH